MRYTVSRICDLSAPAAQNPKQETASGKIALCVYISKPALEEVGFEPLLPLCCVSPSDLNAKAPGVEHSLFRSECHRHLHNAWGVGGFASLLQRLQSTRGNRRLSLTVHLRGILVNVAHVMIPQEYGEGGLFDPSLSCSYFHSYQWFKVLLQGFLLLLNALALVRHVHMWAVKPSRFMLMMHSGFSVPNTTEDFQRPPLDLGARYAAPSMNAKPSMLNCHVWKKPYVVQALPACLIQRLALRLGNAPLGTAD